MSEMPPASDGAFDYHGWVQRALRFMDRVALIDGVHVRPRTVEPPQPDLAIRGQPIPPVLAEFLRSGAGALDCSFVYEPDERGRRVLKAMFPFNSTAYGGARLSSAREMVDAVSAVRDWAREVIGAYDPVGREIWEHAWPFALIDNGDYLALDLRSEVADPPVVYLNHDDESFPLAPSFPAFLAAWERLCYIGPEHWFLEEFRGDDGFLDPDSPRAAALRALFGDDAPNP